MTHTFQKDQLEVKIYPTRVDMGRAAAEDVAKTIRMFLLDKSELNMIFAAAPSQNEFLEALCSYKDIDWHRINVFHMDEYVGLPKEATQRFGNFLKERIFDKLPFKTVNYLNGEHPNPKEECERYAELLHQYPADIVCLGIGENGHIAFNDPHVALFMDPDLVKVVDLDDTCRMQQVNDGCFSSFEAVPSYAFTLTIPALICAGRIFCIVPGKTKARALLHTINDPVSESIPATILRNHGHTLLYADADSSSLIENSFPKTCNNYSHTLNS